LNDEPGIEDGEPSPSTDDESTAASDDAVSPASTVASAKPASDDSATAANTQAEPPTGDEPANAITATDAAVATLLVDSALEPEEASTAARTPDVAAAGKEDNLVIVTRLPEGNALKRYHFRFATFYGALAGILVAAIVSFAIFVVRPGVKPAPRGRAGHRHRAQQQKSPMRLGPTSERSTVSISPGRSWSLWFRDHRTSTAGRARS